MRAFRRGCASLDEKPRPGPNDPDRFTLTSSTPAREVREFSARFAAVADTADFAFAFCERNGIPRQTALRLRLILEELLTNSIRHGYRAERDTGIRIELDVIGGCPAIVYEDSAPPYDPLTRMSAPPSGNDMSVDAPPGDGVGIVLIGNLTDRAQYVYEDGHNRLSLVVRS
jgi:anti-sigma regulatory factor (Ser/Thr protein kinase)